MLAEGCPLYMLHLYILLMCVCCLGFNVSSTIRRNSRSPPSEWFISSYSSSKVHGLGMICKVCYLAIHDICQRSDYMIDLSGNITGTCIKESAEYVRGLCCGGVVKFFEAWRHCCSFYVVCLLKTYGALS